MLRVEVDDNLGRAIFSLARAESGTQDAMRAAAEAKISSTWAQSLSAASGTELERRLIADGSDADVESAGPAFTLWAGIGDPVSGGLGTGDRDWAGVEFGMTPRQINAPNRRKTVRIAGSGREVKVATTIWIGANFKPRNPDGYVAFPTIRTHVPRFVAAWVEGLIGQFDDVNDTALEIS